MRQQYFTLQNSIQYLQEYNGFQEFTEIKLTDHNNERYLYPVLTSKCKHIKYATNLEEVLNAINISGFFKCECNNLARHPSQLQKDIRWDANEEINEIFDDGLVIHNKLFHHFKRARRYNTALTDQFVLSSLKILLEQQNSNNIIQIFQRMMQNYQTQKPIYFKAMCLLDLVSLNIPVRFFGCQHPECYDLASLLVYYNENSIYQSSSDKLKQFKCKQRTCQVKVDISTVQKLFDNIYIETELLKIIQKGLPSIYQYSYNPNTRQIQQDIVLQDNAIVDPQIQCRYLQENKNVPASNEAYQKYQKQVTEYAHVILQRTSIVKAEQKLRLFKYKIFVIPAIIENIKQPARCINCHVSQVMELKYLLSSFQTQKDLYKQQVKQLKCPLCEKMFNYNSFIPNVVYFDKNLFDAFDQGFLEKSGQTYVYDGKKLMKDEFLQKQKVELIEFKKHLQKDNENQICTFTQLYCCSNPAIPISLPLILKNCPEQRIVDFESFYYSIQQLEVDNYEKQCLKFCNCQYCSNHPFSFEELAFNVYFHEAFYIALTQFNKSKSKNKPDQFTYDFKSNRIIEESVHSKSIKSIHINIKSFYQGFTSLQDDKYKENFLPYQKEPNKMFCAYVTSNQITTELAILQNNREGYKGDASTKLKQVNEKMRNNEIAKKYGFVITETNSQFKDGFIKLAVGNASSKQN
ncbi:unnamed protein product (macronuclear) [Paramecium tetraurelia]|uniref:Uncharacterized protein n=1 Tax=Paramecium tetraurelia TaxID=5888 RepID=A0BWZ3_PARTE|nr:uncharacterized protein GSPATT00032912001 [Paramecium tetraurelia]CAK63060.1 unnamed protein product [Paramecium tetraurelia]|eukprot:XP_001430458.1 hypothetical protein (macronuclear) [Paramecium tetraurelia strain d4-2]